MAKSIAPMSECASVINRFPEDAPLAAELAANDETFRALCEEHALATEAVQRAKGGADAYDATFYEYLGIIRDLEQEIATAIANEKRSFRRSAATVGPPPKRDASMP
jgi:hypothetical protein